MDNLTEEQKMVNKKFFATKIVGIALGVLLGLFVQKEDKKTVKILSWIVVVIGTFMMSQKLDVVFRFVEEDDEDEYWDDDFEETLEELDELEDLADLEELDELEELKQLDGV